ncbi:MAG: hypothetical protein JWO43_518 [Candidatus Adlerbacteria bacterium]|nr:hypothetical protein [Candidatus Adlerbacteria bacterium]
MAKLYTIDMRYKTPLFALFVVLLLAGLVVFYIHGKPPAVQIEWRPASTLPTSYAVSQNYTWYALQDNTISCMGTPLPEADASTFVASSLDGYGKDKNHVYWCYQVVAEADPVTFTILSKEYAKDAEHVFLVGGSIIAGADPATFAPVLYLSPQAIDPLQTGYGKDKNHVYSLDHALPNADPATFTLDPVPSDKNWIYLNDTVVGPARLITDNVQYSKALPTDCNTPGADAIYPRVFPPAFSADGSVVGYPNDFSICVIDKKTNSIQIFPHGTEQGVSISKDGSKILYFKYQSEGAAMNGETCADCGQYSLDRVTGKVQKIPSNLL